MTALDHELTIELDLRGAALDGESRAFATGLLDNWTQNPPSFALTLRHANALGAPIPESLRHSPSSRNAPNAILSLWPVWPLRAPAPVVLFIGRGARDVRWWSPRCWRARRLPLVLVPTRREKVELQVLRRFRRDRIWSMDMAPSGQVAESALLWMALSRMNPPEIPGASFDVARVTIQI